MILSTKKLPEFFCINIACIHWTAQFYSNIICPAKVMSPIQINTVKLKRSIHMMKQFINSFSSILCKFFHYSWQKTKFLHLSAIINILILNIKRILIWFLMKIIPEKYISVSSLFLSNIQAIICFFEKFFIFCAIIWTIWCSNRTCYSQVFKIINKFPFNLCSYRS